jgi:hypothetical protein
VQPHSKKSKCRLENETALAFFALTGWLPEERAGMWPQLRRRIRYRRIPVTFSLNFDEAILVGEHNPECGSNTDETAVHR